MRLVDAYGADDRTSMEHDNTSAFNCRWRAGQPGVWSQHAFGRAIDVNPVENPYVWSGGVSPWNGAPYVDRSNRRRGMIFHGDAVWWAFRNRSWEWGGDWTVREGLSALLSQRPLTALAGVAGRSVAGEAEEVVRVDRAAVPRMPLEMVVRCGGVARWRRRSR